MVKLNKTQLKKYGAGVAYTLLYTLWHIAHTATLIYSHLIFLNMMADKSLHHVYITQYKFWVSFRNYMASFTSDPSGRSQKWYAFILLLFILMVIYGIRYAAATHFAANLSAFACVWVIRFVCGFYPNIKIGPANFFINLRSALAYTTTALGLALLLYLPFYYYKRSKQGKDPWYN